jgi:hypothetical protein
VLQKETTGGNPTIKEQSMTKFTYIDSEGEGKETVKEAPFSVSNLPPKAAGWAILGFAMAPGYERVCLDVIRVSQVNTDLVVDFGDDRCMDKIIIHNWQAT